MDKNFVNIDDLVRKRMGGAEEREPAGAWQQMHQLLDKEMPQERPPFGFGWRRMFTAVALILLIGSAGVGTYKIAVSFSNDKPTGQSGEPAKTAVKTTGAMDQSSSSAVSAVNSSEQAQQGHNTANENTVADDSQPLLTAGHFTGNKTLTGNPANANYNSPVGTNHISSADEDRNDMQVADAGTQNTIGGQPSVADVNDQNARSTTFTPVNNNTDGKAVNGNAGNDAVTGLATRNTPSYSGSGAVNSVAGTGISGNRNSMSQQGNAPGVATGRNNAAGNAPGEVSKTAIADRNIASGTANRNSRTGAAGNNGSNIVEEVAAVSPSGSNDARNGKSSRHRKSNTMDKMQGTGNVILPAGTVMNGMNTNGVATINMLNTMDGNPEARSISSGEGVKKGKKHSATQNGVPVFITQSGKRVPGDKLQRLNLEKTRQHKNGNSDATADALKNKKVIERMAIVEHFIKTAPNTGFYRIDTVSVVTFTEELGIITETKTTVPPAKAKSGELNSSTKNKAYADADEEIVPAAKASSGYSTGAMSSDAHKHAASGSLTFENLSAAFNDVKYHVSGMQFVPGITAGVNGTFFGPNSIKGFQFGFTANLVFSDKVSVVTGLMYFHRMNNFSLTDNYYSYTPVNGGYTKELQQNSYSFSTLHSFELPVALSYTHDKFSFFGGANLAYNLAVNTGAATQADPATATFTQAAGNDDAPKLKAQDFGARLGVGYLFGISYKVSPNISFDLRNVQTIWTSGNSEGSRIINDQLYKSPSFQFSFQYHLGGNRNQ